MQKSLSSHHIQYILIYDSPYQGGAKWNAAQNKKILVKNTNGLVDRRWIKTQVRQVQGVGCLSHAPEPTFYLPKQ